MIRLAKQNEAKEIASILSMCGKHLRENGIDQWDSSYPNLETINNDISNETCFVYLENDVIIACIVLNEIQDEEYFELKWLTSNEEKQLVVHRLGVDPKHQGKGIARKLMDFCEDFAKEKNYDSIRLDTFSQNPRNQRFYLNRGYTEIGSVYLKYKKDSPYFCYELLLN